MHRIDRRTLLQILGGTALAGGFGLGPVRAAVQGELEIRAEDTDDVELAWYKAANADFIAANPGVEIEVDYIDTATMIEKITTALAANTPPDVVAGSGLARVATLASLGVLELVDDVAESIGVDDFFPGVLERFTFNGQLLGIPRQASPFVLWYRTDLAEKSGVAAPTTWNEHLAFAKANTGDGIYGCVVPAGINTATCNYVFSQIRLNGGFIVDPDLKPVLNSPENKQTLEYIKELAQFSPPGMANFGYADQINLFLTGIAASTVYTGRVLQRAAAKNPEVARSLGAVPQPHSKAPFSNSEPNGSYIFAGAKNKEAAKAWIVEAMQDPDRLVKWLLTAPGNQLPLRASIASSQQFTSEPLFTANPKVLEVLNEGAKTGFSLFQESKDHKPNPQGGTLETGPILPTVLQKYLINGESAEAALEWGQKQVEDLMADI